MFTKLHPGEVDVFVYSAYLRPGLHSIIIYDPVENLYYKKTIVVEVTQNAEKKVELDSMLRELTAQVAKKLRRSVSVFAQWQNDLDICVSGQGVVGGQAGADNGGDTNTQKLSRHLKQAFNVDTIPKNFKPYLFVADPNDINDCLDLLQLEFRNIKNLQLYISTSQGGNLSRSEPLNYPFISEGRMKDFCSEIGLIEETKPVEQKEPPISPPIFEKQGSPEARGEEDPPGEQKAQAEGTQPGS